MRHLNTCLLGGMALLAAAGMAQAQKSADTLRVAIDDPFAVLDPYHLPHAEASFFSRTTYGHLLKLDEHKGEFVPELAKSWTRMSPTVIEFELRDDVVFHSGNKFTSADVKHTIDYIKDPKTRIRFKNRYDWIQTVEVLGPTKVRITSTKPRATDLSTLAYHIPMYDSGVYKTLEKPSDYGRESASGTGPYRMVALDRTEGARFEKFDKYHGSAHRRAPIKRVQAKWMPDQQTQIAQLITGGVDVVRNVSVDNARELERSDRIATSPTNSKTLLYITLDAAGRSKNKVMTDERVRKALIMAINRDELVREILPGGRIAEIPKAICFQSTTGCKPTVGALPYQPDEAKKLLAQAGYPNGLDLHFDVLAENKEIGEAVAGYLRRAGIRATVEPVLRSVHVKKRGGGEYTAFLGPYPTSSQPDVENIMDVFFGGDRDYAQDPLIKTAMKNASTEFDPAKRAAIYTPALDRINEKAYIMPVSELPIIYAHTRDVRLEKNLLSAGETRMSDFFWK